MCHRKTQEMSIVKPASSLLLLLNVVEPWQTDDSAESTTTRTTPALLGLRQALKISIYDYLSRFYQINAELFINCYDAYNCYYIYRVKLNTCLKTYVIVNDQLHGTSQT